MDKQKIVVLIDGCLVEITEGGLSEPPATPEPIVDTYHYVKKTDNHPLSGDANGHARLFRIPGYREYYQMVRRKANAIQVDTGTHKHLQKYQKEYRKAKPMVDKLADKLDLPEMAAEALLDSVAVMRSATTAKDRLAAAKQVLEYTMSKPVAKSEMKVSTAEDWLKSIATDDDN